MKIRKKMWKTCCLFDYLNNDTEWHITPKKNISGRAYRPTMGCDSRLPDNRKPFYFWQTHKPNIDTSYDIRI